MSTAEITLKEVYDVVVEVRQDVTAIKEKLDATQVDVRDHETRLRSLEKLVWGAAGIGAVGGAGLAQVFTALLNT